MSQPLLVTDRFSVEEVQHRTDDGSLHTRAVVRHSGAVTIIPLVDAEHICLIRNFRVSVGRTLLELPAGTIEPPEEPEATAHRELVEETGYRARQLERLHSFYMSPGILDERMHVFVAKNLEEIGASREPGEEIENLVVTWEQAVELIQTRQIEDAKTLVGLLMYHCLRSDHLGIVK
jgi:ADP-ribose pyrophosphatase